MAYNMEKEGETMAIKYDKLFALLDKLGHSSTYWLRQNGIHPRTVDKLKKNQVISSETINSLCQLLGCQPGDIMEYVPEEPDKK
jgi:putative transcriptional regulator